MGTMWKGDIKGKYERQARVANGKWLAEQNGRLEPQNVTVGIKGDAGMKASGR